jgi:hypothetical protein
MPEKHKPPPKSVAIAKDGGKARAKVTSKSGGGKAIAISKSSKTNKSAGKKDKKDSNASLAPPRSDEDSVAKEKHKADYRKGQ